MKLIAATAAVAAAGAVVLAPAAHANPVPGQPNCDTSPWGILGLTQIREICDGPRQPDGSWMRHRVTGTPRHYVHPSSHSYCSEYGGCDTTFYEGGWVDEVDTDDETYPVRDDNVPAGEPGHLPG